ncbi:anaphase-promoting complex subunit 5-like [Tropilaelaps mercedesae]|uniref:Anaphase-promoting complex subunit 5 n=1 Tax=Tropilaelaps mercedesae TaxID=418985 RepID=A0A1V9X1X8_9ACAR|nr:anaphase-promoting complex subunit 5-like [Tropilaelaps mercedesae]
MECAYSVSERFRRDFSLTPYSLSVGVAVVSQCHQRLRKVKSFNTTETPHLPPLFELTKAQQRNAMFLFLRLINQADMKYQELLKVSSKALHPTIYDGLIREMGRLRAEGMDAILLKIREIDKFFIDDDADQDCAVHRNSAVGKFLRKLALAVGSLDFTSQVQFAQRVARYVDEEVSEPRLTEIGRPTDQMTLDDVSMAIDTAADDINEGSGDLDESLMSLYGKEKARAFLRRQGQKLRDNPAAALPPKELHREIVQILRSSPDMAEVYYLSFMNHLIFGEYVSAIEDCHKHFLLKRDIAGKKFRYALLSLAMVHRRFGHLKQAELALKECIDLSQQSSDKECLQHALAWLCRTNQDVMSCYIRTLIVQSCQQQLWSLYSVGLQTLSRLGAMSGSPPSTFIEGLTGKCPKQLEAPEVQVNLAISSAILWIGYGFHQNAKLHCEAILHLSQTRVTPAHRDWVVVNESTIMALVFIARYSVLDYDYTTAERLINVARSMVPEYAELKHLVELAALCNTCERALHRDRIEECESAVASLALLSASDSQLYRVRLLQQMGNYEQAVRLVNSLQSEQDSSGVYCNLVSLLLQARILIDAGGDNAIQLILRGLAVCDRFHLRYLEAMFKLELVRAQAKAGFSQDLLKGTLNSVTPMILSHGSKEDKLLLRSIEAEVADGAQSIEEMEICLGQWQSLGDVYKAKRALQYLARRCHDIGDFRRRNLYAKMFRQMLTRPP